MWEQSKKKWLSINWLYRSSDVHRLAEERKREAKDLDYDSSEDGKRGKKYDEEVMKETLEYMSTVRVQEVVVSSSMEDNYPSCISRKVTVKHIDEITNIEDYQKRDKKNNFYYKKLLDISTFKLYDFPLTFLTPIEAIDFDPKKIKNKRPSLKSTQSYTGRKRKKSENQTDNKDKKNERTSSKTNGEEIKDSNRSGTIHDTLKQHLDQICKITEKSLDFLEMILKEQQQQLVERLDIIEQLQTKNNQLCSEIYKQLSNDTELATLLPITKPNEVINQQTNQPIITLSENIPSVKV